MPKLALRSADASKLTSNQEFDFCMSGVRLGELRSQVKDVAFTIGLKGKISEVIYHIFLACP